MTNALNISPFLRLGPPTDIAWHTVKQLTGAVELDKRASDTLF